MGVSDNHPGFEPKILAFTCNWCAYAAADLAGTARVQYPANLRIIRVMCSGMVHPSLVIEAFECGADGVLLMGCHPGECHYQDGNQKAKARSVVIEEVFPHGNRAGTFQACMVFLGRSRTLRAIVRETDEALRRSGPSGYRKNASIDSKSELVQCL